MNKYWPLNDRDKRTLVIGGVILSLYLIYLLIISPLNQAVETRQANLIDKKNTLTFMLGVKAKHSPDDKTKKTDNSALLSIITDQISKSSFKKSTYQLEQTSSGEISLSFQTVPFNAFIVWFNKLCKSYALSVKQLNIDTTDTPGVVRINLILSAN